MDDFPIRHPSSIAQQALAARFGLPWSDGMQDWEWEVADVDRFDAFLETFRSSALSDDERFSLMEVLLQCVEETEPPSNQDAAWRAVEPFLLSRPELHRTTIAYWARLDESDPIALFSISRNMRQVWRAIAI
jgi:hypothetical protein